MATQWTDDQKRVIDTRGNNILVSAAAGSGKTAVLVERIKSLILDPEHPMDLDRLLIVTFTKAAAGEMKARILKAISDEREKDPENQHLSKQMALAGHAQITTIDGFCSYIVRSYGHTIGLTPGFRIADEGELKLLRHDVVAAVLEDAYAKRRDGEFPELEACIETFAPDKTDDRMEEIILAVYRESESNPDPDAWIRQCEAENQVSSPEEMNKTAWMRQLMEGVHEEAESTKYMAESNLALTEQPDGPSAYADTAKCEHELLTKLVMADSYGAWRSLLYSFEDKRLSTKKPAAGENPALRDTFKETRTAVMNMVGSWKKLFLVSEEQAYEDIRSCAGPLMTLLTLVKNFRDAYAEEKSRRNVLEFADLEHSALRILRDENGRTDAAKELAAQFEAVMIDEYQDSNYLQEAILTAISRIDDGENNYFCVGDVKQSIYSFRQARPDLFMQKFHEYPKFPERGIRIDLHKNFRSGKEVVDSVNGIFRQIMREEVGGVEYDDDAALVQGADYSYNGEGTPLDCKTEILPILTGETDEDGETLLDDTSAQAKVELEARTIGSRIRQMMNGGQLVDGKTGQLRPIEYRDIVILMRSVSSTADTMVRVLEGMQIPVYSDAKGGYFDAPEVRVVLSFLSLLDNAQNDIAVAAVLRSAFVGLTAEDLAEIRMVPDVENWSGTVEANYISFYDAARQYAKTGEQMALRNRLETFFDFYDSLKEDIQDTPLHELVYRMITESGYLAYVSALPGGAQRELNLRMLVDQAADYENTSYIGLFNFVRYIENLRKQEISPDEQSTIAENENVVRIYTIHKSKGLEYPIVFLAGMSKRFNLMDLAGNPLIHADMGLASDYIDLTDRVKRTTLRKEAIKAKMRRDAAGEELRVLYVAMTRAKQKLIMVGSVKDEESIRKMDLLLPLSETHLPAGYLVSSASYFAWVIPAAQRMIQRAKLEGGDCPVEILPVKVTDLATEETVAGIQRESAIRELRELKPDVVYDADMRMKLAARFSYRYPYEGRESIPVEVSVSALKHHEFDDPEDTTTAVEELVPHYEQQETEAEPLVPDFIRKMRKASAAKMETAAEYEELDFFSDEPVVDLTALPEQKEPETVAPLRGAERGTAYHHVMELMDFSGTEELEGNDLIFELADRMQKLEDSARLTKEEMATVRASDVAAFVGSEIGRRFVKAETEGRLFREQPFVMEVPASRIRDDWPDEEPVFVQGIIDVFFYEGDDIVLLDYKTDRVDTAEELVDRYKIQLESYASALEQASGKKVTESWIWSFTLKKMILVS